MAGLRVRLDESHYFAYYTRMNQSQSPQDILSTYISQKYLNSDAQLGLNSHFKNSSIGLLQLDNFLVSEVAKSSNQFLNGHAEYGAIYGYTGEKKSTADKNKWLTAPESERFFCYEMLEANSGSALDVTAISFLKLRHFLQSDAFQAFIETLTTRDLRAVTPIRVHRMKTGHYLKTHSDRGNDRDIAFILYLSPEWSADFGGDLHIIDRDGNRTTYNPTYNKLLIFDVNQHKHHYISEITEQAANLGTCRISINGWFLKSTDKHTP